MTIKTKIVDATIRDKDGNIISGKENFEVPEDWSDRAAQIVASKYATDKETSVLQIIDRVVNQITEWGVEQDYFKDKEFYSNDSIKNDLSIWEASIHDAPDYIKFAKKLKEILIDQRGTFNTPVWLNIGVPENKSQSSACFLATIEDNMEDISTHHIRSGRIFKSGSGVGFNVSKLRAKGEKLSNKGTSSGPVSFMRPWDRTAGVVKSGGKCLAPWQKVYTENGPIEISKLIEKDFCVISYDPPSGQYKIKKGKAWKQEFQKELVRIITDKGSFVVTKDHPIKINGSEDYIYAKDLSKGMSLFQCSIDNFMHKYIRIHLRNNKKGKNLFHRMLVRDILKKEIKNKVIHHIDGNSYNNDLSNLQVLSPKEHSFIHGKELAEKGLHVFQNQYFGKSGEENPMHRTSPFWQNKDKVAKLKEIHSKQMTTSRARKMQPFATKKRMMNLAYILINKGHDLSTFDRYLKARKKEIGKLGVSNKKQLEKIENHFGSYENFYKEIRENNHEVISIEELGFSEVYSLEVDCLTADDKTKNSGHNYVIWPENNNTVFGSGIVVSNSRRAAVLVAMNINHPDIEEFIECKSKEENKARTLIEAGIPIEEAYSTVDFQNANHSVVVTDEFMKAVKEDLDWNLYNRGNKQIAKTVKAKDLFRKIATQAWYTGDPGLQFSDTINVYNPLKNTGDIECSNPCFTGDMRLYTKNGAKSFKELALLKEEIDLINPINNRYGQIAKGKVWSSGIKNTIKLTTEKGHVLKCTPDHIWILKDGSKCKAIDLLGKQIMSFDDLSSKIIKMEDNGEEEVFDFSIDTDKHWGIIEGFVAHNCGEVYLPPWGCCQLFCFNLSKYVDNKGYTLEGLLQKDCNIVVTAMDILIGNADYPTEEFKKEAIETRPLGIGATDLAGFLIKKGLAYNSEKGREAAQRIIYMITELCTKESINLSKKLGPFKRFEEERDSTLYVYNKVLKDYYNYEIFTHGIRNCTVTSLAPNGTTGMMVDSSGTGIEPLFALKQTKQLSGGGTLEWVPDCVKKYNTLYKEKDPEVLKTANEIHWKDHLLMTAALQKVISMGLSKTTNLPSEATVEDIERAYIMAWELGLKGITVYRDGSKELQPLSDANKKAKKEKTKVETKIIYQPTRNKLPASIKTIRHKIDIAGFEGYLHVGLYENGEPGEIFIRASKQGSFVLGMLDAFATMVSIAMQYGVPLKDLVDKFKGQRFEPNGITQNEDIRFCTSIIDYIFKWLENNFLNKQLELPLDKIKEEKQEIGIQTYENVCPECGGFMQQSGTCHYCTNCGENFGGCS